MSLASSAFKAYYHRDEKDSGNPPLKSISLVRSYPQPFEPVNRHFFPALKEAGLPSIRFHDFRRTDTSLLFEPNENLKYIQAQMGRSSPRVTLNVQAHLMKPTDQETACRLENSVFGTTGHKN